MADNAHAISQPLPTFWERHRTLDKMLSRVKIGGLRFIGKPVAVAIGVILVILQILLVVFTSKTIGKAFILANALLMIYHACAHTRTVEERMQSMKECAFKIALGFVHALSFGILATPNIFQNTITIEGVEERITIKGLINKNLINSFGFGVELTKHMLKGLDKMITAEREKIEDIKNPNNVCVRERGKHGLNIVHEHDPNNHDGDRGFRPFGGRGQRLGSN